MGGAAGNVKYLIAAFQTTSSIQETDEFTGLAQVGAYIPP